MLLSPFVVFAGVQPKILRYILKEFTKTQIK